MKNTDILIGSAHVPAHAEGGWALPGGGRTDDRKTAEKVAAALSKLIGDRSPVASVRVLK